MGRSDAELLEAARRGEREAYGALIERYQGAVCAVSYSRTRDRALSEDVAQDTFIAAWHQLGQLREAGRLRAWLCGIARNLARKARSRARRETGLDGIVVFDGGNPFDATAAAESERVVRDALASVPATYRDALVLFYREQRSVRDVALALGVTEAAAMQRLARGRRYLADGVTDLVERSLRGHAPVRNLAALVLAGLPALAPSRVDAATPSHGAKMIKIAILAGALAATGTTALVVHARQAPPAARTARAAPAAPAATPSIAKPPIARAVTAPPTLPAAAPEAAERPPLDRATIERTHLYRGPARGPADAPVTIVVFDDLLCTYCGEALASVDQLWDEYPGKLRLVVKHFPVHAAAMLPAEASLAADAQGKFWELYNLMMAHQDDLSREVLLELGRQAGLDLPAFRAALDQHRFAAAVAADQATGRELDVDATPTFLINGRRISGALPVARFRALIDDALTDR
jgi:RNA polymerase sigma factor (sigma-70 family)